MWLRVPATVCAHTCTLRLIPRVPRAGPRLAGLAELLTPLAYQAAEPSGCEILSEWQQWEPHLPFNAGPARVSASVCTCVFLSDALVQQDAK